MVILHSFLADRKQQQDKIQHFLYRAGRSVYKKQLSHTSLSCPRYDQRRWGGPRRTVGALRGRLLAALLDWPAMRNRPLGTTPAYSTIVYRPTYVDVVRHQCCSIVAEARRERLAHAVCSWCCRTGCCGSGCCSEPAASQNDRCGYCQETLSHDFSNHSDAVRVLCELKPIVIMLMLLYKHGYRWSRPPRVSVPRLRPLVRRARQMARG